MTAKIKLITVFTVVVFLSLPEVALTQGPGRAGRVYSRLTRRVFATLTAYFASGPPAGDAVLIAGNIIEPGGATGIVVPAGWSGTVVSETRAGFVANVSIMGNVCPASTIMFDTSARSGLVQIIGGNWFVPDMCNGIASVGSSGVPLTVTSARITGATAAAVFLGILLDDESGGPFRLENNTISGQLIFGIRTGGFPLGLTSANVTIRGNRIINTGPGHFGDGISAQTVVTSTVLIERNIVEGGGANSGSLAAVGIFILDKDAASSIIVQRNTVRNFTIATGGVGNGIRVRLAPNTMVLRNQIQNNSVGVSVDALGATPSTGTVVNFNNITSLLAGAIGLDFNAAAVAVADLDATNNFWGNSTGPADTIGDGDADDSTCGGNPCGTASGGGLRITNNMVDAAGGDCGPASAVPVVLTCPFRPTAVFPAGA